MRNFLICACAAFLLLDPIGARSQQPAPRPSATGQGQQQKTATANQPATANDSNATLPPIVVNVIQPQDTEEEKREKRREREDHATFERWTSISTIVIALFTVVLAVSTGFLWLDTRRSSNAAQKAANVAERALVDLERPWVFVDISSIRITEGVIANERSRRTYSIQYDLVNHGRTTAFLTKFHQAVHWLDGRGEMPKSIDTDQVIESLPHGTVIQGGGRRCVVVDFTKFMPRVDPNFPNDDLITRLARTLVGERGQLSVYLLGLIRYQDVFAREHPTWFCAKFDELSKTFVLSGDSRYNHSE